MTEIIFQESEPGLAPYTSRLLVTESFLRMDDGSDDGDFVLYDRKKGEIHSFNQEQQTHLLISPGDSAKIDFIVDFTHREQELTDAPAVNGRRPVQHHFFANEQLCRQSINVPGLLEDAALALQEYQQALTEQSKTTLLRVPSAMRTACYMANNYLHVNEYLKVGFPLFTQDHQGRKKRLVSYRTEVRSSSVFRFPDGYELYRPQDIR